MRLPLAVPLDSRNSSVNKDARLFNMLVENYQGKPYVVSRAALEAFITQSGAAGGVIQFNNTTVAVFGTALYKVIAGPAVESEGTVVAGTYDFAQTST